MTDINPLPSWAAVRQLEIGEYALGGANGNMNEQAKSLAARSEFLKQHAAYQYNTMAEANADIANIAVNQNVNVVDSGLYLKATTSATTLTKSPYDPLTQAENYTNQALLEKTSGVISVNLFDKNAPDVMLGYIPNIDSGLPQATSSYNMTGFIPVVAGEKYSFSTKKYLAWYNSSKTFISGSPLSETKRTLIAPAGAAFVRASALVADWYSFQIEKSVIPTPFIKYGAVLDRERIVSNSIDEGAISFKKIGSNLFNKNTAKSGVSVGVNGTETANPTYAASDFIAVESSTQYYATDGTLGLRFCCYYDESQNVITGGIDDYTKTTKLITTPATAKYIRITFDIGTVNKFKFEKGSAPTAYIPFGYVLIGKNGEKFFADVGLDSIKENNIVDKSVTAAKVNFLQPTKNLFNKAAVTVGKLIDPVSAGMIGNAIYSSSDYIPIEPSTSYYGMGDLGMRTVAFFTSGKTIIPSGINDSTMTVKAFTTPANAFYCRIGVKADNVIKFQLEKGATQTSFVPYGFVSQLPDGTPIISPVSIGVASTWSGKSWATLGDSITEQARWQSYVVSKFGFIWTNFGAGGTKISGVSADANAMCQDTRINAIPTTVDLITLMGGTNDWAQNVPLGDINSTDPLTFYGALNTFAQKAYTRWSTKRIAVATTPYGEIPDWTGRAGWTSPAHNSLGLTTNDYAEAIRQFCKRKNVHCIDVALSGGWGTHNITEALGGSTTDHLHPASGSNAAKGIAVAHIKGFKDIEPI